MIISISKGHEETFGCNGIVHYLDHGGGFSDVDLCESSLNSTLYTIKVCCASVIN